MAAIQKEVEQVITNWDNDEARERAEGLQDRYGEPDEVTDRRLIWNHDEGPGAESSWKRTMIIDEAIPHNYPVPHEDFLYQVTSYPINVGKANKVLEFDGSAIIDVVKGEIGSRCHMERANFITTNMAVDIMEGKRTAQDARRFMATSMKQNENKEYLTGLQFEPQEFDLAHNPDVEFEA